MTLRQLAWFVFIIGEQTSLSIKFSQISGAWAAHNHSASETRVMFCARLEWGSLQDGQSDFLRHLNHTPLMVGPRKRGGLRVEFQQQSFSCVLQHWSSAGAAP